MTPSTLRCPCGEERLALAYRYTEPPPGEILFGIVEGYEREYRRCGVCGHFFARYGMELGELYTRAYVDATYGDAAGVRRTFERIIALPPERSDNAGRSARIQAFANQAFTNRTGSAPESRTLLDVGAGLGVFPYAMRRLGWTVTALDPDPRNESHYRDVIGVTPAIGDFRNVDPDRLGRFHAVTFNKVLEHLPDPVAMLERVHPLLHDDGFVYVEVPDVAAAAEGPNREEFLFGHDHVFSTASLALLLVHAGLMPLRIERIREPSTKYTLFAFARRRRPNETTAEVSA